MNLSRARHVELWMYVAPHRDVHVMASDRRTAIGSSSGGASRSSGVLGFCLATDGSALGPIVL